MQDIEYLKSMYPSGMKMLQSYVSEACDRLDYYNSPMYDEFPDNLVVNRICDSICDTVLSIEGTETMRNFWNIEEAGGKLQTEEISSEVDAADSEAETEDNKGERINSIVIEEKKAASELEEEGAGNLEAQEMRCHPERKVQMFPYVPSERKRFQQDQRNDATDSWVEREDEIMKGQERRRGSELPWAGGNMSREGQRGSGRRPQENRPPQQPGRPPQGPWMPPQQPGRPPQGPWMPPQQPGRPPQGPWMPPQQPGRPPQGPWMPSPQPGRPPQGPWMPSPQPGRPPQGPWMPSPQPGRPPQGPWMPSPQPGRPPQGPWMPSPQPGRPPQGPNRPPMPPNRPPRPIPPPTHGRRPSWLRDVVKVLLLNEMHNRRCARGICRF